MARSRQRSLAALSALAALPLLAGAVGPTGAAGASAGSVTSGPIAAQAADVTTSAVEALNVAAAAKAPTLAAASPTVGLVAGPTTHWVSPNAKFTVKVQLTADGSPVGGKGSVILQQKFGDRWVNVGKPAKFNAKGQAAIAAVSEDLQLETTYRVSSGDSLNSDAFTVELGAGKHTSVKLFKGSPRWEPCKSATEKKPIVYQLNLTKKPSNWDSAEADIKAAIADVSARTGIKYVQAETGTTSKFPTKTSLDFDAGVDMVIAAGDATDSTFLPAKVGKVLAVGGWTKTGGSTFINKGYVMIDNRQTLEGGAPAAGKGTWQMVVRHELAHAMGVTHPSDSKQVMNPTYNNILTTWGAGDLNALQLVGVRKPTTMVFGQTADACHAAS